MILRTVLLELLRHAVVCFRKSNLLEKYHPSCCRILEDDQRYEDIDITFGANITATRLSPNVSSRAAAFRPVS